MAVFNKKEDLELIRESGRKLSKILMEVKKKVKVGVSTLELDEFAQELIKKEGATPAFLDYTPDGADYPYPSALCVSVNEENSDKNNKKEPAKSDNLVHARSPTAKKSF